MSLMSRRRQRKQLELALSASTPTDFHISNDGEYQEGDIQISKSGMSISSPATPFKPEIQTPMTDEEIQLDHLEILDDIGRGSGGIVKKVRHKISGKLMALKIIQLDVNSEVRKRILLELKTLYHAQSPHIVNFYGAFFTEGHIYICLELMDAGSLHSLLQLTGPFPEPVIAYISMMVLQGLLYLHKDRHLVHRDIKPSNILINTKGEVKISDFGVSGQLASSISSCVSWVGTVTYMSPERIQGKSYSTPSDIWSFGLSILELALGRFPYHESGTKVQVAHEGLGFWELLDKIVQKDIPELPTDKASDDLRSFVAQCLVKTPDKRPSAAEMLEHPFIKKYEKNSFSLSSWITKYVTPAPTKTSTPSPEKQVVGGSSSKERLSISLSAPLPSSLPSPTPASSSSGQQATGGSSAEEPKMKTTRSSEFGKKEGSDDVDKKLSKMMLKKLF